MKYILIIIFVVTACVPINKDESKEVRPCSTLQKEQGFSIWQKFPLREKPLTNCRPCTQATTKQEQEVCKGFLDLL